MILSKMATVKAEINRVSSVQLSMQVRHQTGWAIVENEGRSGCSNDIRDRLQNLHGDFRDYGMLAVWGSQWNWKESRETLIRPVLQYGCETWMITKTDERKLISFQCQCSRQIDILRVRWQQRITNTRVVEIAEINCNGTMESIL